MITSQLLNDIFTYTDGKLLWRVRRRKISLGSEAGYDWVDPARPHSRPRRQVRVDGNLYFRSRLVWIMYNGDIPDGMQVDHINGDSSDDRIENLRLATNLQNNWNKGLTRQNRSGVKGVRLVSRLKSKPWVARAKVNGKQHNLGYFATPEEAKAAYDQFVAGLCGDFANKGDSE